MQQRKINPPSQDDFEEIHRSFYIDEHGNRIANMKAVCARAGISPSKLSRRLNDEEAIRDHLYDSVMEIFGAVESGQAEVGRKVVQLFNKYASEFGLLDEEPISILSLSIDQLYRTQIEDIRAMSSQERALTEMYAGELKEVAGHVHQDAILVRREEEVRPRNTETHESWRAKSSGSR